MKKKIMGFIHTFLIILSVVFACYIFTPPETIAACDHTFVTVILGDGSKWLFEYDCDGRIVNIYPEI